MQFFVGLHQPSDAGKVPAAFISVLRLWTRRKAVGARAWIMDSGAFSIIAKHGGYPAWMSPRAYAERIKYFAGPKLFAAVAQDYMCEPHMFARTGLTVAEHQRLTVERYDALVNQDVGGTYIMPVLQGYAPEDYVRHIDMYGDRLAFSVWVGVGSICKRNADPSAILEVLRAIKARRPELRLHGFGLKWTSLVQPEIQKLLHTADSMAWSFAARREGRGPDANSAAEALKFALKIQALMVH